ncbi:M20 family metallopeptidase [Demequina capsici]|uniref:M20 family metallopeptidase n=1 Tax=Demequina capsici TaxID=3075620 RepID=A0AA96F524_9MICO|nr:M20 family metallopeptidase [Demequina sp. OYTSA14]WNM23258.1 M20 family metallopeptidase [Demequina sp. OYTSA14]
MTLLDAARDRLDAMIADARTLIACESPSEDPAAVERSADVTAAVVDARLAQAGLAVPVERIVVDGAPHLRWTFGGGARRVLLVCHHDTVWPLGTLERIPFSLADGVMRGPGCYDMVVGTVQALHAVCALASAGGAAAVDGVTLLVTADEEVGSPSSRALIESEARKHGAALVLEASGPGGAVKTERKGVSWYELEVMGRAAHSGLEPERGVNAGVELAHQILALASLADVDAGTTVTPTRGAIGTTGNTVPASARVSIDVRCRTAAEQDRVDAALHALRPVVAGARLVVHGGVNRRPLERSSASSLFERASALAAEAGIEALDQVAVGGASDGNFTAGVGTPTLDGLGAVGGGAHADDEHVLVEHIPSRTALVALLIRDLVREGTR